MIKTPFSVEEFKDKSVHIVGVTGSEGSAILRFLTKEKFEHITVHDYRPLKWLEKSFKLWHKGMTTKLRNDAFEVFTEDLKKVHKNFEDDYLKGIESADIIFAPQSWRLYKEQNAPLFQVHQKGIPFYSLIGLYLDLSPATVVGVTGTVGKGSVSHLIHDVLKGSGKSVYYGGNDTWNKQPLEEVMSLTSTDYLVLEISHRQLQEGIGKSPHTTVLTNIYPNHLDEISWEEYKKLKFSLFANQTSSDYAVLNKDYEDAESLSMQIKSKVIFFSAKNPEVNTKYVQNLYEYFMRNKSNHLLENILAAGSALELLGISSNQAISAISNSSPPGARIQKIAEGNGVEWYDDLKSTTPWATLALIRKLGKDTILIMGGKTKGINYKNALAEIQKGVQKLIIVTSELSLEAQKYLTVDSFAAVDTLKEALVLAKKEAREGTKIAVSPGCAFFYTDFIQGKESVSKIIALLRGKSQT